MFLLQYDKSEQCLRKQDVFLFNKMTIRPLTPVLAEKARVELNEDQNRLKDDLQHLQDWIAKQPHLRARTDDQWLVAFLRSCKFSLERTKEKIDLYYSVRTAAAELFRVKHTTPIFTQIVNDGGFISLPKTMGPDSPRVTMSIFRRISINKYSIIDMVGAMDTLEKIAFMEDDHLIVAGGIIILDCEGVSIGLFTQLSPTLLKKLSVIGQDASPLRMKGIHVVNAPAGVETIFNLMKSLIVEKNRNRFHMHSSLEDLYKHIPKDILPAEYGGDGGTIAEIADSMRSKAKEYSTFLDEEANFGTDEHKRPGKPRTVEDMFGTDGSFRKLEVD